MNKMYVILFAMSYVIFAGCNTISENTTETIREPEILYVGKLSDEQLAVSLGIQGITVRESMFSNLERWVLHFQDMGFSLLTIINPYENDKVFSFIQHSGIDLHMSVPTLLQKGMLSEGETFDTKINALYGQDGIHCIVENSIKYINADYHNDGDVYWVYKTDTGGFIGNEQPFSGSVYSRYPYFGKNINEAKTKVVSIGKITRDELTNAYYCQHMTKEDGLVIFWTEKTPNAYYIISGGAHIFLESDGIAGPSSAFDIDNEDGTSSFIVDNQRVSLYTITSVPSIEDTEALVDYYFNGDPSFWFESPEDMTAEKISTLVQHFLYQYGLPTTTLGNYYPLIWTGDIPWSEITNQSFFTNDPTRDVQQLSFKRVDKDITSYHCFFCEADRPPQDYDGEDQNNLFIDLAGKFGVAKSTLPNYIPLQHFGIQAIDGLFGYTKGYLVLFPFKFPVDHETFRTVQTKEQLQFGASTSFPSLRELAGEWRRPRFQNADVIYDKYLGDDKDWVYYWIDGMYTPGLSIDRVQKVSDFAFVSSEKKD